MIPFRALLICLLSLFSFYCYKRSSVLLFEVHFYDLSWGSLQLQVLVLLKWMNNSVEWIQNDTDWIAQQLRAQSHPLTQSWYSSYVQVCADYSPLALYSFAHNIHIHSFFGLFRMMYRGLDKVLLPEGCPLGMWCCFFCYDVAEWALESHHFKMVNTMCPVELLACLYQLHYKHCCTMWLLYMQCCTLNYMLYV